MDLIRFEDRSVHVHATKTHPPHNPYSQTSLPLVELLSNLKKVKIYSFLELTQESYRKTSSVWQQTNRSVSRSFLQRSFGIRLGDRFKSCNEVRTKVYYTLHLLRHWQDLKRIFRAFIVWQSGLVISEYPGNMNFTLAD